MLQLAPGFRSNLKQNTEFSRSRRIKSQAAISSQKLPGTAVDFSTPRPRLSLRNCGAQEAEEGCALAEMGLHASVTWRER